VEVSSPEVYGSVSEKFARKNMAFEKHMGVITTPLGSSRVNELHTRVKKTMECWQKIDWIEFDDILHVLFYFQPTI